MLGLIVLTGMTLFFAAVASLCDPTRSRVIVGGLGAVMFVPTLLALSQTWPGMAVLSIAAVGALILAWLYALVYILDDVIETKRQIKRDRRLNR